MAVVIRKTDGSIDIMRLIDPAAQVQEEVDKWKDTHPNKYLAHLVVADQDIPADRTLRDAWTHDGVTFGLDAGKVAAINDAKNRYAVDETERLAAKIDAQIIGDINMDAATVATIIDNLFPAFTNQQRTFLKRLVRLAQIGARAKLRNGL
jgi:hypothetical protein